MSDKAGCLVFRLERLAVDLGVRVGEVALDVLDRAGIGDHDSALAALLHLEQDFVFDLHIPGKVEVAGLDHGARGRDRIAAAFHFEGVEVRPVRHVIVRIDLATDEVARPEIDENVGAGADGFQVSRRIARLGAM